MDVDSYIKEQKSPQREIIQRLRAVIRKTCPGIKEELKNGVPWYGRYYLVGLKDHVNMGFSISGLPEKEMGLFEGKGKLMRHLKFYSVADVDEKRITELIRIARKSRCDCG